MKYYTTVKKSKEQLGNKIKHIQIGKKEVKLPLLAGDMILYIENLNESTTIIIRINEFSKVEA